MPMQTFFNLQKDKQKKILDASKKEFSEYSFYDASINRIIKDAGISRGSFYQYFENKEDLFVYILESSKNMIIEEVSKKIKGKRCDVFELHLLVFDVITKEGLMGKDKDFIITTISNMNIKLINHLLGFSLSMDINKELDQLSRIVNFDNLRSTEMEYLINIHNILTNTMMFQLVVFFSNLEESEKCRENLISQLELIKNGVIKK